MGEAVIAIAIVLVVAVCACLIIGNDDYDDWSGA